LFINGLGASDILFILIGICYPEKNKIEIKLYVIKLNLIKIKI